MSEKSFEHHFSIDLFCKGNMREYNHVFELYYDTMYLFAYNMIKSQAEAKDIATETFIKLWKLHPNFESLENIKAFLYVTTRNACTDHLRFVQRQKAAQKEILYLLDNEQKIEHAMINAEIIHELSLRIEDLPQKCKEIFKLFYYHQLRTIDIANLLNITPRNVLNQKSRAIHLLRSFLVKRAFLEASALFIIFYVTFG